MRNLKWKSVQRWLGVLAAVALTGCSLTPSAPVRDDPLIGRMFDAQGQELEVTRLLDRMAEADVVYLGEKHDNAAQHRIQLDLLQGLLDRGVRPAVGFEFFDVGQTGLLMHYVEGQKSAMQMLPSKAKRSAEEVLREQLGWSDRTDEEWGYYFALLELAKQAQLPVFGADLPPGLRLRLSRAGRDGLNGVEAGQLTDTGFESAAYRALMFDKFTRAHCGWGEPTLLERLYQTWLARNDRMASSIVQMREHEPQRPVVMVLGKGHTEHGMGVLERVAALAPGVVQVDLGLTEIAREPLALRDYLAPVSTQGTRFASTHQFYWFTQRQDYQDPCEGMNRPHKAS